MSREFESLNIEIEELDELIREYCVKNFKEGFEISEIKQNPKNITQYTCNITYDSKKITLNFYKKGNGTVTIQYAVGKHQDISKEIAEYIKLNGVKDDRKSVSPTVENISEENFELLLEYINELNVENLENSPIPYGHKYKFKGIKSKDELTITYYNNKNKLLIQGKPLYIYSEVVSFLSKFMGFEDVIKNHSKTHNIDINPEEVVNSMKKNLEDSYDFIGTTLHKVLSPVFIFRKLEVSLDDYSAFVFPALRALEGYLKKILFNNNIEIVKSFDIFSRDEATGLYYIDDLRCNKKYRCRISCSNTRDAVEEIYNFLSKNRHPMFHTNYIVDATMIIEDRSEAEEIIDNTLELIKRTYHKIS